MLVVSFSSDIFADDEITEKDYVEYAEERARVVLVSKFYLSNGKYGYNLYTNKGYRHGSIEARASELCKEKGYNIIREETFNDSVRRQIIQCNE